MKAKSIKGKSTKEIKAALEESIADGFSPTLAIAFISKSQDRTAISDILDQKSITVFGCTTNGEFIDEDHTKESAAILLLDMNRENFRVLFAEYPDKNYREVAAELATDAKKIFANPAFLISGSHTETDGEQLLLGLADIAGEQVNVFGGMAGDDYAFNEQFVFTNDKESNRGMVVLAVDEDKIIIRGKATCGWKAVGTEKTVTKSEGNHVYTVDNIPVLDLTIKYGGIENIEENDPNIAMEIAVNFPLQLQREFGDPVMRPGLLVDWNDHSFYCSGTVPQGSKVRFSIPPDFDVMEKVIKAAEEMKIVEMPEADAVIVFSCAGRIIALGPLMNMEIEGIRNVWNVPMAGMFSNAELARATGGNLEMHNCTTCVVALKEK